MNNAPQRPRIRRKKRPLSRFMRKTLMPDERVIREAHFHVMHSITAFFSFLVCFGAGWGVRYGIYKTMGWTVSIPVFAGAGIGLWMMFWILLQKWTTEIILTDRRLLYKRGFFLVNVDEVSIEQLASDYVQQSLLGRMLDYGTLHIRCIEASDLWLPPIADPYAFRNAIELEKQEFREHYMDIGRMRRRAGVERASPTG